MKRPGQTLAAAYTAYRSGNSAQAEKICRSIVAKQPKDAGTLNLLAQILRERGEVATALDLLKKAIAAQPTAEIYCNAGACLIDLNRSDEAVEALRTSLELDGRYVLSLLNLALIEQQRGDAEAAERYVRGALDIHPRIPEAHLILAQLLSARGEVAGAKASLETALEVKPDFYHALEQLGIILFERDAAAAEKVFRAALKVQPDAPHALYGLASALDKVGRHGEAAEAFERVTQLDPANLMALSMFVRQRRRVCDWRQYDAETARLHRGVAEGELISPFVLLTVPSTPEQQLACAANWARIKLSRFPRLPPRPPSSSPRIKVGYLSCDLQAHATAFLMAELLERHDRSRFEVIAYSYAPDDGSAMRQRLIKAVDHFVDVTTLSFEETAQRIRADAVDILVDLKGYTGGARSEIPSFRPAPIQINYLGYPGSLGGDFVDYIIADSFVIPPGSEKYYSENVIRLPHSYQPNDTKRKIANVSLSRAQFGLPDDAFVFCSFNNTYKITPDIFDIWMRLLAAVPGSVLWLLQSNPEVTDNLRREAALRGVDPDRLVFATPLELSGHLARHRLADLFLDTTPVNAHTTASDALWAGLPVLTWPNESFVGRVAGSLLRAVGLPELIAGSLQEYEAMALQLARNPEQMASLRRKLEANRLTEPLFDIERYTRSFERALIRAWELWQAGEPPTAFDVEDEAAPSAAPVPPPQPAAVEGGRIRYDACPMCDQTGMSVVGEADCSAHPMYKPLLAPKIVWQRCSNCGHLFTEGHLAPDVEQALLGTAREDRKVAYDIERQRPLVARIVAKVAKHRPAGTWLDVGSGNAALLITAQEWGYRLAGLDRDAGNGETLRRLGIQGESLPIERLAGAGAYDVVSFLETLEEEAFPRAALAAAARLLAPGGVLFISTPNADAMVWRILTAMGTNPYWGEPALCHAFGRQSLDAVLRALGFEVLEYGVSERVRAGMELVAKRMGAPV